MAKERKDYCGPYWMPSVLRRAVSSKFNASCKIHDMDYESKKFSREEADKRFRKHTLKQAGKSRFWRIIARIFYGLVRIGGKISYNKVS